MDSNRYREARKKVKAKKDFYGHLVSFIVMSAFFFALNMLTSPWSLWFYWPILGWGIAVIFHYFEVFGIPGVGQLDKDWEEKAIQEELDRMRRTRGTEDEFQEEDEFLDLDEERRKRAKRPQERTSKRNWNDSDLV